LVHFQIINSNPFQQREGDLLIKNTILNSMTPEKLQSLFKWFESFNSKELEPLSLIMNDASTFSPKIKRNIPKAMVLLAAKKFLRSWWKDALNVNA
jgi:hypothetical protein